MRQTHAVHRRPRPAGPEDEPLPDDVEANKVSENADRWLREHPPE